MKLQQHKNKKINATKNNQIVENKYRSKIRRHLNKIESRIKQNPKNNNQPTNERTRTQTQKNRKPPTLPKARLPNFQKTPNFPQKTTTKIVVYM